MPRTRSRSDLAVRSEGRGKSRRFPAAAAGSFQVRPAPAHLLLLVLLPAIAVATAARVEIANFSREGLTGWKEKSFSGHTRYEVRDGALCASSSAAASGLFREIRVDLGQTPWLHWSWRIDKGLHGGDERSKEGDDYPARVYVVFSGGLAFWRTRAINYVWSGAEPEGTIWPNAFTANARMVAVRSGKQHLGEWLEERRDVRADYRRIFGAEAPTVDAVAIMTDTDNTATSAAACYGDIWFANEQDTAGK